MATEAGYEGGIGGKLRTRQFRRAQATPYDRPPAAARGSRGNRLDAEAAAEAGRRSRWISRLVDPASTLITKGATRLFSSMFGRRLGALPPAESPVVDIEPRQAVPEASNTNLLPEIEEQGSKSKDYSRNHSDDDGISELEQLLKQKTFTRAEYDHLTELLRSRTVDLPKENESNRIESSTLLPAGDYKKQKDVNFAPKDSRIESSMFIETISTPGPTLRIPEEKLASPAEVAKAFMGSRPSKVSPSSLSLRSQMLREATASPSFIGFAPKASAVPICSKLNIRFSGVPGTVENGYMTPRSRGRSAIYKMSRSPYFKRPPTVTLKDVESSEDGYPGPSVSTQGTPVDLAFPSGKQVLKRRSSVLESDLGSVGPIRRIRQKSSLVSPSDGIVSQFSGKFLQTEKALDNIQHSSSIQRSLTLHEHVYDTSDVKNVESQEERIGYSSVPPQSREVAKKILQQLDKLVPSSKGESGEAKIISRNELPPKLLKNVAEIDASKLFNVETNGKLEGLNKFPAASPTSSISQKKGEAENGPSRTAFSDAKVASEARGVVSIVASAAETRPIKGSLDSVFSHSALGTLQKKPAFKMQAPEDALENGDDSCNGRDVSGPSPSGKEKEKMSGHKLVASETELTKKAFAFSSESMSASNITSGKVSAKGVCDGSSVSDKGSGFTFPVSLPSATQCQVPLTPTAQSLAVEEPSPSGQNAVPRFTFGSKSTPLTLSSGMTSITDPSSLKYEARSDSKGQLLDSSSSTVTTTPVEHTESGKVEKTQTNGDLLKSASTTSNSFQFIASSVPGQSNGSPTLNSSIFSVSSASGASLSGNLPNSIFSAGPATVSCTSSEPSGAPTSSVLPSFRFGSSSSAVSTDSTSFVVKSVSTDLGPNLIKESSFGIVSSSAAAASTFSSTASSAFGFSASASSGAAFSSSAGPAFSSQVAQTGSGTSLSAQSTTSQFGSMPAFGLAASPFGFSNSVFGSSISSAKPFGVGSGFGSSPAAAGSSTSSSSSFAPTATNPSVFGSSSQSTVSSIFGSGFGTSTSSVSTYGVSSATSATTATTSFGSLSVSPFSSSSSASTSSVFLFSQPATTSSPAFSFTSGATTSAPLSPAVPTFGISNSPVSFVSGSPGNDQMNVEDSMADDTVQRTVPPTPTFGQPSNVPAPSLPFSSPTPSGAPVFQFASSQPSTFPTSQTSFQATGSFEFSMGSGGVGGDKSGRRFIKAKRDKHKRK